MRQTRMVKNVPGGLICGLLSLMCCLSLGRTSDETENASGDIVGTHPGGVAEGKILPRFQPAPGDEMAAFSDGCFWGIEETLRHVPGVVATAVGYMGGTVAFPSYALAHQTGHSETVLVEYNPKRLLYTQLLEQYWKLYHPTVKPGELPTRRSPRARTKYMIWTYTAEQTREAKASLARHERLEKRRILTRIEPAAPFYLAEDYHQQYDEKAGIQSCAVH